MISFRGTCLFLCGPYYEQLAWFMIFLYVHKFTIFSQCFPPDTGADSTTTFVAPLAMSAIPLEVEHVDEPAEGVPLNQLPQVV